MPFQFSSYIPANGPCFPKIGLVLKRRTVHPKNRLYFVSNGKKDANTDAEKKFVKVTAGKKLSKAYPGLIKKTPM